MIIIALGANLPSRFGEPADTLRIAVRAIESVGISVVARSSIWLTAPVPFDPDVPYYHNAVIAVETNLLASDLLQVMLNIEEDFGRVRSYKNAPRLLDLDLIAYNNDVIKEAERLIVPHPRMHERSFVLSPLEEISQNWTHPISGQNIKKMVHDLPADQEAEKLEGVSL
ncbi:MAG: 2-amino-4-hydroxy-6-hydroxymethyldihydropteridine diphosphokinase [Alphaproteobacteria bacterium]|nr:2-amino-4-hydroxy-6-hydroxymethyldihydropteridine diphosphokinase [Alphaproteobacteria bacterium]